MTQRHPSVAILVALSLAISLLAACGKRDQPEPTATTTAPGETADQFIARVNDEYRKLYPEMTSAQWLSSTYINDDSQLLAAKANERYLSQLNRWIEQGSKFEGQPMSPATARAIRLLKLQTSMPAPKDPAKLQELTRIATRMEGMYGAGTYCSGPEDARQCRQLGELEDVLRSSRDYDKQLDAWQGWHSVSPPMRADYTRFASLANEGAREMGFADTGELWRSGYDMTPVAMAAETDRLWSQVKPLYEQLHCYARNKLEAQYGKDKGQVKGLLPAHLMGNMWQQDWSNLWDLLQPYKNAGSLDVTGALEKQGNAEYDKQVTAAHLGTIDPFEDARTQGYGELLKQLGHAPSADERALLNQRAYDEAIARVASIRRSADTVMAKHMAERAQDFYMSLGMPKLPESYWMRSQFTKPLDRDVVCHASAWDMNLAGDVRTKMCIKADEEDFTTIYHELGHVYYYLAYNKLPPLFQGGANDGFHEAIGDTMVLAMTPRYLNSIGLVGTPQQGDQALINSQMRMALAKVSFLPFGLMIDRWRWGVFDGSIKPDHYNQAWWQLKAQYQGVAPATPRGEEFFDAGAKYHVPGNTPYTRYFLSHILQFQFYKGLCDASGYKGPLYDCTFYGNKVAGQKFWAMLEKGSSQPWQGTLKELTGNDRIDAAPVLEYFAPLQAWLKQQNEGQTCGWKTPVITPANAQPPTTKQ